MKSKTFYYSRGMGVLWLFVWILFIGLSCWGIFFTDAAMSKKAMVGLILPVFIYAAITAVRSTIIPAFKRKPALIMDEKGIYFVDEDVVFSWNNIDSVKMLYPKRQAIYITVKNKQAIKSKDLTPKIFNRESISLTPSDYAESEGIFEFFDLIRAFCSEYSSNPGNITFSRPQREIWPSEG